VIVGARRRRRLRGAARGVIAGFAGWRGPSSPLRLASSRRRRSGSCAGGARAAPGLAERVGVLAACCRPLTTIFILAQRYRLHLYRAAPTHFGGLSAAVLPACCCRSALAGALGNYAAGNWRSGWGHPYGGRIVILATATLAFISVIPHLPLSIAGPALIGSWCPGAWSAGPFRRARRAG